MGKKVTHKTLCRVFVAYREEMTGTWINNYSPFVSGFSTDADATTLTSTEVSRNPPSCHTSDDTKTVNCDVSCDILLEIVRLPIGMCICSMIANFTHHWQHSSTMHPLQLAESRKQMLMSGALHTGALHPWP